MDSDLTGVAAKFGALIGLGCREPSPSRPSGFHPLRTSSLTAIVHALDLELVLVPRKSVPAVKSVTRSVGTSPMVDSAIGKEFRKTEKTLKSLSVYPAKADGLDHLRGRTH